MKIAMLGVKAVPTTGGIAQYTEQLSKRLVARGHEVTVYCRGHYLDNTDGTSPSPYLGINRRLSTGIRGKYLDALTHSLTAALDSLRRDYDIVHIHGSAPAALAPLLRIRRGRPLIVTIHAKDWAGKKWGGLATRMMKLAAGIPVRFAHGLTVVSRKLQEYYADTFGVDTTYIPTGVEIPEVVAADLINEQWGLVPNGYVLFVGRLTPEKGLEYLLPAYTQIDTDKRLVIVGDPGSDDQYVDKLRSYDDNQVIFTGFQSGRALAELFSNAYLYVQPSTLEGLSVAVLEALSYGRCVLASNIEGNEEALGPCGYTFEVGSVESLRMQMDRLITNPDLTAEQFDRARSYVRQNHSWDLSTKAFEHQYRQLLA